MITIELIRSFRPCYDPERHIPEGWAGTALDILKMKHVPSRDKIWLLCRPGLLEQEILEQIDKQIPSVFLENSEHFNLQCTYLVDSKRLVKFIINLIEGGTLAFSEIKCEEEEDEHAI